MNKKIVLMTIMFGASVCSQQMWTMTETESTVPVDIIKNETESDIEYKLFYQFQNLDAKYSQNSDHMLCASGVVAANSEQRIQYTAECSRDKISKIFVIQKERYPGNNPSGLSKNFNKNFDATKNRTFIIKDEELSPDFEMCSGCTSGYDIEVSQ